MMIPGGWWNISFQSFQHLLSSGSSGSSGSSTIHLRLRPLPLLLIANPSRLSLKITHIAQVNPHSSSTKRIRLRPSTVFLISCTKPSYEGVEGAPSLAKRAGTRCWRVREPEEGAAMVVNLGFPELVEVVEELKNMCPTAEVEGEWWTVVPKVLAEGVPVSPLLVLVAAWRSSGSSAATSSSSTVGGGGGGGGWRRSGVCCCCCWFRNQIHG